MRYVPNKKLQIIRLSPPPLLWIEMKTINQHGEGAAGAAAASRWRINKSKHYSSIRIYLMLLSMSNGFWCEWVSCGKQEIASEINCTQCKLWKVCQHVVEIGKCAVDLLLLHRCCRSHPAPHFQCWKITSGALNLCKMKSLNRLTRQQHHHHHLDRSTLEGAGIKPHF